MLRHRDFRLLFWGQAASSFGSNAVAVAMAIYITRTTGSASDLGLILAAQTVPLVVLVLLGGVWADRLPRHRVMIVSDLIRAAVHAVLAVLILAGSAQVWEIALIEVVFGASWAFFQPAYTGLLPQTVPEDELQAARALTQGVWNLSLVLGPSLGTALVLTLGAGEAFALDAASFLVSAVTLLPVQPRLRGDQAEQPPHERVVYALAAGFREVSSRPWVWVTISSFSVVVMCSYAPWEALGPIVVRDAYGSVGLFGVFVALYGVGSVAGSAIGSVWRSHRPLRDALLLAAIWPGMSIVVALALPRLFVGVWMCLAGIQSGLFMVIWETSLARHVPPGALSRVSSYDWMGSLALLPIGFALGGPLASLFGARTVLGVGGAIGVAATFLMLVPSSTRHLSDTPTTHSSPAEADQYPSPPVSPAGGPFG